MSDEYWVRRIGASDNKRTQKLEAAEACVEAAKDEIERLTRLNKQLQESSRIEQDDLRSKNASIQEELQEAKRENKVLGGERRKAEEERRKAEEERRRADEERREVERDMKEVTAEMREAQKATAAAERELVKLRKEDEEFLEKFGAGTDNHAAPQSQQEISDSEVVSQFTHLIEQVKYWVYEEVCEPQSLKELEAVLTGQYPRKLLGCLAMHLKPEHMRLAEEHARLRPMILCCLIHCHLEHSILAEKPSLFGIDDEKVALLEGIEPDAPLILKALCNIKEFQARQRARAVEVSQSLYSALSWILPGWNNEGDELEKLHEQITVPAVRLAMSIRFSTNTYRMLRGLSPTSIVYEEDVHQCVIKDLATNRTLTPANRGNVAGVGRNGRIGKWMLIVHPGLQRCRDGVRNSVVLCKPLILVQLDAPLQTRSRLGYSFVA